MITSEELATNIERIKLSYKRKLHASETYLGA